LNPTRNRTKAKKSFLPRSTFVIDNPRRGDRITRKQIDVLKYFMKLRDSRSSEELLIAAAFRSISDERHDDVDELLESRRSFFKQIQLRNILIVRHTILLHDSTQLKIILFANNFPH
jgi:hypothetical protein